MKHSTLRPVGGVSLGGTFAAFRHRNYRLWFLGQLVSLVGTWTQSTAQGYLVYELTKSPAFLGYVGFAAGAPTWLFTLYGGVIADRFSRRQLLIITQFGMMILAFLLAGLVFTGRIQAWQIVGMALLLGIANSFDAPARQAFVVEMVERQDLANAIALNSTMFNMATVVGPAVGGLTYAWLGPAWCFTLNGISFITVIIALLLMNIRPAVAPVRRNSAIHDLGEGLKYVRSDQVTWVLIANLGLLSVFGMSMLTLLPAWSVEVLGGDVTTNGALLSARGAGALVGALMIAVLGGTKLKGKLWAVGNLLFPFVLIFFALARGLPLALTAMVILGWSFMIQGNTSNAMIQMRVPDALRGRVMSIFTLVFFGGSPLGALLVGGLAAYFGEPRTLILTALALMGFIALIWARVPAVRSLE